MAKTGRPPTCVCGECAKCVRREKNRLRYQALSLEERRELIAKRDPEKTRAADRARYYRQKEERQAEMRRWRAANRERVNRLAAESAARYPEKAKARQTLANAIRAGFIVRPNACEHCREACKPQAHHHDYSQPLDVLWLCVACHGREHRQYEDARRAA